MALFRLFFRSPPDSRQAIVEERRSFHFLYQLHSGLQLRRHLKHCFTSTLTRFKARNTIIGMSAVKKSIEQLWMSGHSEDYIVKYVSIMKALRGNFCMQAPTIRRHVRNEIARMKRKGLRPATNSRNC